MIDLRANVQASFSGWFLVVLEYHISTALKRSRHKKLKYFFCDGVDEPLINEQFNKKNIKYLKSIYTACWFGYDGQGRWLMEIKLGECAKATCLNGLNLEDCLPDLDSIDWIDIDDQEHIIVIELK